MLARLGGCAARRRPRSRADLVLVSWGVAARPPRLSSSPAVARASATAVELAGLWARRVAARRRGERRRRAADRDASRPHARRAAARTREPPRRATVGAPTSAARRRAARPVVAARRDRSGARGQLPRPRRCRPPRRTRRPRTSARGTSGRSAAKPSGVLLGSRAQSFGDAARTPASKMDAPSARAGARPSRRALAAQARVERSGVRRCRMRGARVESVGRQAISAEGDEFFVEAPRLGAPAREETFDDVARTQPCHLVADAASRVVRVAATLDLADGGRARRSRCRRLTAVARARARRDVAADRRRTPTCASTCSSRARCAPRGDQRRRRARRR